MKKNRGCVGNRRSQWPRKKGTEKGGRTYRGTVGGNESSLLIRAKKSSNAIAKRHNLGLRREGNPKRGMGEEIETGEYFRKLPRYWGVVVVTIKRKHKP